MKQIFILLSLAGVLSCGTSYASKNYNAKGLPGDINPAVEHSFSETFKKASDIKWSVMKNLYKANFISNGQYITAYYDVEGTLVAATRSISPVDLPISLETKLKNNYTDYWVSDLIEFDMEDGITYYMVIENADQKITLKSVSNSEWSLYKKEQKS